MSANKMDAKSFAQGLATFGATAKQQWDLATTLAVSAVLTYREDGDKAQVAELHEALTNGNGTFAMCFEKFVWATTNLKFKQDEEDLSKPVTVYFGGDNPKEYVTAVNETEKLGLSKWGGKVKSKRKAAKLNRNGEANVTSVNTGNSDPTKGKDLTDDQKKLVEHIEKQREADLKSVLDGTYKPDNSGNAPADTGAAVSLGNEALDKTYQSIVDKLNAIAAVDPSKLSGIMKDMDNKLGQIQGALSKLAKAS